MPTITNHEPINLVNYLVLYNRMIYIHKRSNVITLNIEMYASFSFKKIV